MSFKNLKGDKLINLRIEAREIGVKNKSKGVSEVTKSIEPQTATFLPLLPRKKDRSPKYFFFCCLSWNAILV